CIWRSFMSSSASRVSVFSLRSIEPLLPLKSKRVSISRRMPWMALSTSAMSVLETMSKEGTAAIPVPNRATLPQARRGRHARGPPDRAGVLPPREGPTRLLPDAAVGRLRILVPQGRDEAVDAAAVLDHGGELRALRPLHADARDDGVDDGEPALGGPQPPVDMGVPGGTHVDLAVHEDGAAVLGAGVGDREALAHVLAEGHRIGTD